MQSKVNLDFDELQILIQCIEGLNFSGKHVIKVGLLADKLLKELLKLEEQNKEKVK